MLRRRQSDHPSSATPSAYVIIPSSSEEASDNSYHHANGTAGGTSSNLPSSSSFTSLTSLTNNNNDKMTSSHDRTREFQSTVKSMQVRHSNGVVSRAGHGKTNHYKSEFSVRAKKIGTDLSNTYAKLEKLTVLAKSRSLFDDKPLEIQELTYIIKEDINQMNRQIAGLQDVSRRDRGGESSKHQQKHSSTIVVALQSRLANMSNNFKRVLEIRTANMKDQRSRRENFTQGTVSSSLPQSATQGYHAGSVLLQSDYNNTGDGGAVAVNMEAVMQDQQLLHDTTYIESRANTMETIESTIVELGQIFQQLAHMVHEQEELITRIDSNVTDAQLNVEGAHTELLKYFQSVSSSRWLMIKIFFVLIVFFIIFVVFLA